MIHPKIALWLVWSLYSLTEFAGAVTHECVPGKYQNPIVWVQPGDPVEIRSPKNFVVTETETLSCLWEIRPQWGSKLEIKVNEKNVNYKCWDNELTLRSAINKEVDYKTACNKDNFPSLLKTIVDDGPILVNFKSNSNDGSVKFKITFTSVDPPIIEDNWKKKSSCPDGPCCSGKDCCIYNVDEPEDISDLGGNHTSWRKGLYDMTSSETSVPRKNCIAKLRAPPGFQVSVNFLHLNMLESADGSCKGDYVKLYEDVKTTTFSLVGQKGLTFCGQHLPNSPAPSIFSSSGTDLYIQYKTDDTERKRGVNYGFKLTATAINPLVTMAKFSHKYGENTCHDTCNATVPIPQPTTTTIIPPPPPCLKRNNKIFITEADQPHAYIPNAKIKFRTEINDEIKKFEKFTNNDGLIDFTTDKDNKIESGQAYFLTIITNDYVEKTIDVHLHCEKKTGKLCPSCYFYKKVTPPSTTPAPPPETSPREASEKVTGATLKEQTETPSVSEKVTNAPSVKPGKTTAAKKVGKTTTAPKTPAATKIPIATTVKKLPSATSGKPAATTTSNKVEKSTTVRNIPGTTLPPDEERFPSCEDKDSVNSVNQLICDCTVTKCDAAILKKTGECEPCIEVPVVEPPTTPTVTPCVGEHCTTQAPTTPCKEDRNVIINVIDANSKEPLLGAIVVLSHEKAGFIGVDDTNSAGQAKLEVSLDGKYRVKINKRGYKRGYGNAVLNCNTTTIDVKIIRRQPCEKLYLILKARREVIAPDSGEYRRIRSFLKMNKNGKIGYEGEAGKRTQVLLNSKDARDIKGYQRRRWWYVVYDVTGMVPSAFTFTLSDVRGPKGGYENSTTSLTYEQCSYNSKWIRIGRKRMRECCIKQHLVTVYLPRLPTIVPPGCAPLPQYFHVRVCGEASYRTYGDPSITLGASTNYKGIGYYAIQNKVRISTIANQITTNDENLKCPGNTTLIKEYMYYFDPQNLKIHKSTFIIKVNEEKNKNGEGFEATRASKYVYCPNLEKIPILDGDCFCNGTIQVVVVPKKCHNEYFTVVIKDAGTDTILPGVTITVRLISGEKYEERVTNEQGLVNIKMDRAIKQLKLSISKTGYDTNDKETLAINCNQKECGECQLKLTTTINKHECPDPMNVTATVKTTDGKAVPNTPIKLVLVGETGTGSSRQVKERTTTDNFGQRTLVIRENGRYQIQVQSDNNIDKVEEFVIDKCEHKDVLIELPPIFTKSTSPPCKDGDPGCTTQVSTMPPCEEANNVQITFNVRDVSLTKTDKNGEPLKNASIVVEYIQKKGQQSNPIKISNSKLRTDSEGVLKVPATTNGNYTYSLSKKGYLKDPTVGFIIVDCDPEKGCNCSPTVNISVKEPKCDPKEYPQNLFINVTDGLDHTCIPGAEVILTLKSHGGTIKTEEIGRKITPDDCIVSYLRPVNGKYDIEIKKKNYIKYQEEMDYHCNPEECQTCNVSIAVPLEKEFCDNITMKVTVIDAENNTMPIIGAKFSMTMEGADSGVVKHIDRKEIPSNGVMYIKLDKNGNYHYTVEAPGYITYTDTHKVNITLENCETYLPIRPTVITHPLKENCTRASLTWTKTPLDLDLYTFRVMYSDSSKHCQTYFCNEKQLCGCTTFDTENVYQGDQGAETITLCCKDIFSYMIYVDNRQIQNMSLANSGARITLFSNIKTQKVDMEIPTSGVGEYQRYWIAGCLVAGDGDFTYIPVNQFTVNQPSSAEPLLCHNLVDTLREKKKRDNFPKDAQIQVSAIDIGTHENIPGVSIKLAAMRNNKIVQQEKITADGTSRADSKLSFTLGENGRYKVTAEKKGYTSAPVYSTINCASTTCSIQPINMYMLKKLTPGDIRISLTYQEDRPYYLSLFQVNKLNSKESCDAIKGYDPLKKTVSCTGMELEWSSYPGITKFGNENGDSVLLRDASSNEKYTYTIYVAKINMPDEFTYLTISDSKNDKVLKVKASNSNTTQEIFWIAGCLSIEGTSFNFVEKDLWLTQDPTIDGRLMCHSIFTDTKKTAVWSEPPPFCTGSSLTVIAKDINGNIIENVNTTTTNVLDYSIEYDLDGPKPDLVLQHTINQLTDTKLTGNGVYTTKVEAEGYVTDRVERRVNCDINECEKCSKTTNIVLVKQAEIDTGDTILTVTSQTGAKLLFVIYKSDNSVKLEKNDKQDRITIPHGTNNTKITIAVTQDITETGKLCHTDAVFTLRYGDNLLRLKLPMDAYHNEKYWLIGSIKIKDNKDIEFFSDNFYANVLDVFGSVPRSIGMTLPAQLGQPAQTDYRLHATSDCQNLKILADGTELASLVPPSSSSTFAGTDTSGVLVPKDTTTIQIQCSRHGPTGGIIASADNGLKTDSTWTCSTDSGETWKTASILSRKHKPYLDDSKHISNDAEIIWFHDFTGDGSDWIAQGDILCKTKVD